MKNDVDYDFQNGTEYGMDYEDTLDREDVYEDFVTARDFTYLAEPPEEVPDGPPIPHNDLPWDVRTVEADREDVRW